MGLIDQVEEQAIVSSMTSLEMDTVHSIGVVIRWGFNYILTSSPSVLSPVLGVDSCEESNYESDSNSSLPSTTSN